jgi:hypothetical protein
MIIQELNPYYCNKTFQFKLQCHGVKSITLEFKQKSFLL